MDIATIATAAILGSGITALVVNQLGVYLLKKYNAQILGFVLKYVEFFDDRYIDTFKVKYKDVGTEAEKNLADMLRKAADTIEDKI